MPRLRVKPCGHCADPASTLFRIQWETSGRWDLVCRSCWEQVSRNNPHYVYGGTWKAKKRD